MSEEGTQEFWLPGLFFNYVPRDPGFQQRKEVSPKEGRRGVLSVDGILPMLGAKGPAWLSFLLHPRHSRGEAGVLGIGGGVWWMQESG